MKTQNQINHIDCFSGPGGICTGFKAAGIRTLVAIEKVQSCAETYSANHPEVKVINKDIRDVTVTELKKAVGQTPIHIVTSGMPCETFSTAGSSSRRSYDFRQQLYSEAIRLAKGVNAKMILFENVPAIETKRVEKNGIRLVIDDIIDELAANGYSHYIKTVLLASDFGVPQYRKRFFLLATNENSLKLEIPNTFNTNLVTVKEALAGLPLMEANDPKEYKKYTKGENQYTKQLKDNTFWKLEANWDGRISYHRSPKHRPTTIERFKLIAPGESLVDLFKKFEEKEVRRLQQQKIIPAKWFIQRNKRILLDEPCKTVTAHCLDELVHPTLNRCLTVREVARLQSFPDSYNFIGGPYICPHISETQDKYEQIGDAVPPLLAYAWGRKIQEILNVNK